MVENRSLVQLRSVAHLKANAAFDENTLKPQRSGKAGNQSSPWGRKLRALEILGIDVDPAMFPLIGLVAMIDLPKEHPVKGSADHRPAAADVLHPVSAGGKHLVGIPVAAHHVDELRKADPDSIEPGGSRGSHR